MDNLVSRLENIPLTGEDLCEMVRKLGNHGVRVYKYDDLSRIKTPDQLFGNSNTVLLLLQIKSGHQSIGHWVAVVRNDAGYFYYDPYGLSVEQDMKLTGEKNYINIIFSSTKLRINHHRHQLFKDHVNTCGRHCVLRSLFHSLSNSQYNDKVIKPLIRNHIISNADAFVSLMTAFLDNSDRALFNFFSS